MHILPETSAEITMSYKEITHADCLLDSLKDRVLVLDKNRSARSSALFCLK